MSEFRDQFKEDAEKIAKAELVIEAVSKVEKIEASEEEVETELEEMAKQYNQKIEDLKKRFSEDDLDFIKMGITKRKTVDFLVENTK